MLRTASVEAVGPKDVSRGVLSSEGLVNGVGT